MDSAKLREGGGGVSKRMMHHPFMLHPKNDANLSWFVSPISSTTIDCELLYSGGNNSII